MDLMTFSCGCGVGGIYEPPPDLSGHISKNAKLFQLTRQTIERIVNLDMSGNRFSFIKDSSKHSSEF